jgi:SAM-dependent methyltransferase
MPAWGIRAARTAAVRLFLTSALVLFVELLFLRWIPANIRYIGFFPNFLLMGSFLGIGLGILLGRRGRVSRIPVFPIMLFALVAIVANAQLNVQLRTTEELVFGLASNPDAASVNYLVLPAVVVMTSLVMASLATPLGLLLTELPPLQAYTVDIVGSLSGIAAFTAFSALETPPVVWFTLIALLFGAVSIGRPATPWRLVSVTAIGAVVYMSAFAPGLGASDRWSPYYRITILGTDPVAIYGNGMPFQAMWEVNDSRKPELYQQLYKWFPTRTFRSALIIGAGSGTDTAVALSHGVAHIDAIEIDPVIAQIGRERHPNQPYADSRVTVHIADGRNYLERSTDTYDLVIFALPDSLTLLNAAGNLRLESFLFTDGAFRAAARRVAPDGLLVMYNWYRQPWLVARIADSAARAFGNPPAVRTYADSVAIMVVGHRPLAGLGAVLTGAGDPEADAPVTKTTDDWPYLYLRQPEISPYYIVALAIVLVFAGLATAVAARRSDVPVRRFSPHFFVLGMAFLLIETRSLVTFSLLFGSTWLVNSLVFFGILVSVLGAIFVTARLRPRDPRPLYVLLLLSLGIGFSLDPASLLIDPPWLRYLVAVAIAFAPVFLANLAFTYSFRDVARADMAFASNLLGAVVGGAIEYVALLTGYRALLLIAAGLYLVALLLATRFRFLADRELIAGGPSQR